jgi:phosphoribosylamine--glycine ligase
MNILVIGSGGREHALIWKIRQSPAVKKVYCAPGNAGIARMAECVPIKGEDFAALADFVKRHKIGLTVVGPEIPLAGGIVDYFNALGLPIFGPNKKAAQLEASKAFAKAFMEKYGIPTAKYRSFTDYCEAIDYIGHLPEGQALVVKADGLAAGKGVLICPDRESARQAVEQIMKDKVFGDSGREVVVEEFLEGEEASIQIFLDGKNHHMMAPSQDHKRVDDQDLGPNTGGMGAYAPAPLVTEGIRRTVENEVIAPIIGGLAKEGIDYKGILYIGLMIVRGVPCVLEFNCRFGDPETQVVLPLLKSDLVEIMQKTVAGQLDKIEIEWYNKSAVCVVLVSRGYPGDYEKGKEIRGLEEASLMADAMVFHAGTVHGSAGSILSAGGRVLGVTAVGNGIPETITRVYEAVGKIRFDGMHYRTDIGRKAFKHIRKPSGEAI